MTKPAETDPTAFAKRVAEVMAEAKAAGDSVGEHHERKGSESYTGKPVQDWWLEGQPSVEKANPSANRPAAIRSTGQNPYSEASAPRFAPSNPYLGSSRFTGKPGPEPAERPERQETPDERTQRFLDRSKASPAPRWSPPVGSQFKRPMTAEERAKDDADEAAFMGKPALRQLSHEDLQDELNRRASEARESAHEQAVLRKQHDDHEGAMVNDATNRAMIDRNNSQKYVPQFVTDWANRRIENRSLRSEEERANAAASQRDSDTRAGARFHSGDQYIPGPVQGAVDRFKDSQRTPREPQSFSRGDADEENIRKAIEAAKGAK